MSQVQQMTLEINVEAEILKLMGKNPVRFGDLMIGLPDSIGEIWDCLKELQKRNLQSVKLSRKKTGYKLQYGYIHKKD